MLAQEVLQFYASGNQLDPVGRVGEVIGSGGGAYPVWTNSREGRVAARLPSPVLLWPPERQDGRNNHSRKCGFMRELRSSRAVKCETRP